MTGKRFICPVCGREYGPEFENREDAPARSIGREQHQTGICSEDCWDEFVPLPDGGTDTELVNQRHTDEFDVNIGRGDSGRSHMNNTAVGEPGWLGNPYKASTYGRRTCIRRFKADFEKRIEEDTEFREAVEDLRGKTLACWCVPKPCHGEVILDYLGDGRQALLADGGTVPLEAGEFATDTESRDGDEDTIIVVNRPDTLAHEHHIEATGRTVAAHNQDYSPESPVVEAAYVDDMDASMSRNWREIAAVGLPELVRQVGVSVYSFPEPRLERIEDEEADQ